MKIASGAAAAMTRSSTWKPSKARVRASDSPSWPIEAHTSVWTAAAPATASWGRLDTTGSPPSARRRSMSASVGP